MKQQLSMPKQYGDTHTLELQAGLSLADIYRDDTPATERPFPTEFHD